MFIKGYIPYYKRNLKVAVPIMLTQAGQITVNLADNIMVGHLGTAELAGVSFANSILILGMVFGIGFTQGLTPHVGKSFGKGDHARVGSLLESSITLNIIAGVILTLVMYGMSFFMNSMGQPEDVVLQAKLYYNTLLFSLLPFIVFFGLRQFSEGIGITKYAMYITLVANAINIVLNWALIYGHLGFSPMGVKGAAIATLISRVIMLVSFLVIFFKFKYYNQYIKYFTEKLLNKNVIRDILKTSIPLSFQNLVEITAFSLSAIMVGWSGKTSLASHQVAMSMSSFSFMLALGVGAASTIRVSHQYGFGDYHAMRKEGFAAMHLSVALMSISGIAYILFRNYIPIIYTQDVLVRELAAKLLIIAALFQVFDAMQLSGLAALRALADVKIPLILSIVSYYLVCLPLGYLCGIVLGLGAVGVWIGLLLGLVFAAMLFLLRFNKISNKIISANSQ